MISYFFVVEKIKNDDNDDLRVNSLTQALKKLLLRGLSAYFIQNFFFTVFLFCFGIMYCNYIFINANANKKILKRKNSKNF